MVSCCPPGSAPYLAADHNDEGTIGSISDVSYYQVGSGTNGLLIVPDIWGWNSGRTRAIADDLAKKGLSVWVPKLLTSYQGGTDGDGLPPDFNIAERGSELGPLLGGEWHVKKVVPQLEKVVNAMKSAGVKSIGFLGFCYGAWVGMHLAKSMKLVCAASPHPSATIETMLGGDLAKLAAESQCPWAFYPCGEIGVEGSDPDVYDVGGSVYKALEAKFKGKNETKRFTKMPHGFTTRGNIKPTEFNSGRGEDVKVAVQECIEDIVKFFVKSGLLTQPPQLQSKM